MQPVPGLFASLSDFENFPIKMALISKSEAAKYVLNNRGVIKYLSKLEVRKPNHQGPGSGRIRRELLNIAKRRSRDCEAIRSALDAGSDAWDRACLRVGNRGSPWQSRNFSKSVLGSSRPHTRGWSIAIETHGFTLCYLGRRTGGAAPPLFRDSQGGFI